MRNKIYKIKICFVLASLTLGFIFAGCERYLDKAPEATISSVDAIKDFASFQGFTEECYAQIVDVSKSSYQSEFNIGDDMKGNVTFFLGQYIDDGNYWGWQTAYGSYLRNYGLNFAPNQPLNKGIWTNSWYGIRKANQGLELFDKFVNGTQEEKNIIKGQLLFFRGYFYFELMKNWGGLPYIDRILSPNEEMKFPRLNYRETALKAAADLEQAASLLPVKWDDIQAGQKTLGNNRQRLTNSAAYSFLGKCLLYAASPMMNRESTGKTGYDVELCKKAADAFAKVINLCDQTNVYKLQPFATYSDMFWTRSGSKTLPGGVETIFSSTMFHQAPSGGDMIYSVSGLSNIPYQFGATANYVKNFGMANGLPIDDPASGYNPADPWSNRDARFYKNIVVDGEQIANATSAGADRFAQLYVGGRHRIGSTANVTGYLSKKYWGIGINKFDMNIGDLTYQTLPPIMRLSDVYLMYAESVLQGYGTAQSRATGCITAEEAVNRVRTRATVPNVDAKFTATKDAFMGEILRERAVELCYEGIRWYDLRRLLLATQIKYREKTEQMFDRAANGKPINMSERILCTMVFEEKHYWLPLPVNQVTLYPEFNQNPGW